MVGLGLCLTMTGPKVSLRGVPRDAGWQSRIWYVPRTRIEIARRQFCLRYPSRPPCRSFWNESRFLALNKSVYNYRRRLIETLLEFLEGSFLSSFRRKPESRMTHAFGRSTAFNARLDPVLQRGDGRKAVPALPAGISPNFRPAGTPVATDAKAGGPPKLGNDRQPGRWPLPI